MKYLLFTLMIGFSTITAENTVTPLDKEKLLTTLFNTEYIRVDNNGIWGIWKFLQADMDSISPDGFYHIPEDGYAHTRLDTIFYYTFKEDSMALVVFGTYQVDEDAEIVSGRNYGPILSLALYSKPQNENNWNLTIFRKHYEHSARATFGFPCGKVEKWGKDYYVFSTWDAIGGAGVEGYQADYYDLTPERFLESIPVASFEVSGDGIDGTYYKESAEISITDTANEHFTIEQYYKVKEENNSRDKVIEEKEMKTYNNYTPQNTWKLSKEVIIKEKKRGK